MKYDGPYLKILEDQINAFFTAQYSEWCHDYGNYVRISKNNFPEHAIYLKRYTAQWWFTVRTNWWVSDNEISELFQLMFNTITFDDLETGKQCVDQFLEKYRKLGVFS